MSKKKATKKPRTWRGMTLPDDVEVITVEVPVYTGPVKSDRPHTLDTLTVKWLEADQREAANRIYEATVRLDGGSLPNRKHSRTGSSRWVFTLIAQAMGIVIDKPVRPKVLK